MVSGKACGPDGLPSEMYKRFKCILSPLKIRLQKSIAAICRWVLIYMYGVCKFINLNNYITELLSCCLHMHIVSLLWLPFRLHDVVKPFPHWPPGNSLNPVCTALIKMSLLSTRFSTHIRIKCFHLQCVSFGVFSGVNSLVCLRWDIWENCCPHWSHL